MRDRLATDLGRWEAGELSLVELEARHPGHDVGSLVGLRARLATLAGQPVPDPEPAWAALSTVLTARPQATTRRRSLLSRRRLVAAVVAVAIATPAASYAAAPDAVRALAREVADLLPGGDGADPVAPDDDRPFPTSSVPSTKAGDSRNVGEIDDGEDGGGGGTDADEEQDGEDRGDGQDDDPAADVEGAEERSGLTTDDEPTEASNDETRPQVPG